ncbi:MAG: YceI family protein [Methylomonas sp.]|jgi:polyisoprenoid-binding protein YceI|uniref:YceI family protein n=1 Tax=Methylomonas sp. TaxID=418 RepID=UPI0025D15C59|nr:YceI family protein [Methylomonas sp.]MCK9605476.1 YceI family protein [Methylomonas sp.]
MIKTVFAAAVAGLLLSFSATAADSYTIDNRHTFPSFEINHLGFSIQRGRFNETGGKVVLDSAAGKGSIDITVNMASISTGLAELEEHLRGKDFFDVNQYPTMRFKADKLSFAGDKLIGADGMLMLHGISKPVHLTVDHFFCGMNMIRLKYTCGANAVTTIKRSDFGIDKYVPMISDQVKVSIQVEATRD